MNTTRSFRVNLDNVIVAPKPYAMLPEKHVQHSDPMMPEGELISNTSKLR
jgi:hypothetical protein